MAAFAGACGGGGRAAWGGGGAVLWRRAAWGGMGMEWIRGVGAVEGTKGATSPAPVRRGFEA
jgi:hypothetical protein